MFSMSLKKQLIIISAIPFLFYAGLSLLNAGQSYALYQKTKEAQVDIILLKALSQVVHETQIERGRSASFLNGGIEFSEVQNQQKKSDEKIAALDGLQTTSALAAKVKADFKEMPAKYRELRGKVESKSLTTPEAISGYNQFITSFLKSEILFAETSDIAELKGALYSMAILEEAKESAGKLRANMTSILTRNIAISDDQLSLLVDLKGKIDANLYSPALVVPDDAKALIADFGKSSEWQEVNRIFKVIIIKSKTGEYAEDPKVFFKTISKSIDAINGITVTHIEDASQKMIAIQSSTFNQLLLIVSALLITLVALVLVSSTIIRRIYSVIQQISRELQEGAKQMSTASQDIATSSVELSESSIEQASALQETVTSIDEINAMVSKNADSARNGRHLSQNSKSATTTGKDRVDELSRVITRINNSSIQVMDEVKNNNTKIAEITKVIADIGEKTKIINDIVFQTKLLSFNASVESARAGEHGKGFSVVAQEIGNLAQMSGNAAQEIAALMAGKTEWVDGIVKETSKKMSHLLQQSDEDVKNGTLTARLCSEALDEIMVNADSVNSIVEEIAVASEEQAKGVNEITKAMQQLDQVTQQNTQVATQSSASAHQLSDQGVKLQLVVDKLVSLIEGAP